MATSFNIAFQEGYIKDEWAKLVEPVYRSVEGRAFLYTGVKPAVGQRTETQIIIQPSSSTSFENGASWCRLSGIVTDVGPLPSTATGEDNTKENKENASGTYYHGQTVTSYAFLNFDFYDRQEHLPFKRSRVYKVRHVADERKSFVWCVESIEDVTEMSQEKMPEAFRKWSEDGSRSRVMKRVSF
mmetsp:Transcript_26838/g.45740  ORF Transcript_26838/g.45740 Transcript_26838/m.45740 type:complete len:185 (-) Transcript_26838:528-1082(-)|eukprot:CAMPEP_0183743932 /NCGR_PEP_ID=MMETSP0737-20130205/65472_1 /TAXON_ID=385413 /ORGANISM="Thalassiosira miniscula, Strain CCMP1093" /LENGTH=184 /DNA_ID=CAMNT_0025979565 /DNA_START=813 /DNA_END=1367 /DNA_ORIENTATION=+